MHSTFNNGIGMVVVDATHAQATAQSLRAAGEMVFEIGRIAWATDPCASAFWKHRHQVQSVRPRSRPAGQT